MILFAGLFCWEVSGQGLGNVSYGKILSADATPYGIECAHADASGNFYLTGASKSTGNFGEALKLGGTLAPSPSGGAYFFYILKHNSSGVLQSSTFLYSNSTSNDNRINVRAITTDPSGNVYISGYFTGTVDFDGGAPLANRVSTSGTTFLAKYDANLNFVWAKNFGGGAGVNVVVPEDIKISPTTGQIWVAGYLVGDNTQAIQNDADPDAGTVQMLGLLTSKAGFACAYNVTTGAYVSGSLTAWINNSFVSTDDVFVKSLAINSLGKIFVAGYFETSMSNCAGLLPISTANPTASFIASFDPGPLNCTLVKYDAAAANTFLDLAIDPSNNNNVYVAGGGSSGGTLLKYNAALALQWSRNPGLKINSIAIDNSNMVNAVGYNSSNNAFIQKYNSTGVAQFGASGFALTNISGDGFEEVQISGTNILLGGTWGFGMGFNSDIGFDDDDLIVSFPNGSTSQNHQFWGIYFLDNLGPIGTVSSTASSSTKISPIPITVTFDEPVIGYVPADHDIINGTISNVVEVNNKTFTFNMVPAGQGTVSYQLFAGMFSDYHNNLNGGSNYFSRIYDTVAPSIVIASTHPDPSPNLNPFPFTIDFSETMLQLAQGDDADKSAILQFRATRRGLTLAPGVANYIVSRAPRAMHELLEVLELLDSASLAQQRALSIPFVKEALGW